MGTFFENQARAQRNTRMLVVLFFAAISGVVASIYGLYMLVAMSRVSQVAQLGGTPARGVRNPFLYPDSWFEPSVFFSIALGVITVITLGSGFKWAQLAKGGKAVAQMMNGRLLMPDTTVANERKVLNIVEEMSIACGLPVPPVYVMDDERSINAFAAGYRTDQAVIGVSRGAIDQLSRDELQGVMAHEFSHILSGDMSTNIRLMALLFGVVCISVIGRVLLQGGRHRRSSIFAGRRKNDKGVLAIWGIGIGLLVIGSIGAFCAKLIQMAISRQREFFADASAVQFTRNPAGIGGALKKIANHAAGGTLHSPHCDEVSHMFFADGVKRMFTGFMATHPPLKKRIAAIEKLAGGEIEIKEKKPRKDSSSTQPEKGDGRGPLGNIATILAGAGMLSADQLTSGANLIGSIPLLLTQSCRDPLSALATVWFVLLAEDPTERQQQLVALDHCITPETGAAFQTLLQKNMKLDSRQKLGLIELAVPALRLLSREQYVLLRQGMQLLIEADHQVTVFEAALDTIIVSVLAPEFEDQRTIGKPNEAERNAAAATLLQVLATVGHPGDATAQQRAIAAASEGLEPLQSIEAKEVTEPGELVESLEKSMAVLRLAKPAYKEQVLTACALCVAADGALEEQEYELLRAVALSFGVPLPPL